ncbi:MAG: S-layer homology domain-containing protein [Clostridia bacterium]|nr:S-layer homology domain-containing protein [Clostridia bacterium]
MNIIINKKTLVYTALLLMVSMLISAFPLYNAAKNVEQMNDKRTDTSIDGRFYDIFINIGENNTSYHVTWQSDNLEPMELQWTTADKVVDGVFPTEHITVKAAMDQTTHRADMSGLKENTEYVYRIGSDSLGWTKPYYTKTGDFDDGSFSFIAAGDPQLGTGGSAQVQDVSWDLTLKKARVWFGDKIEFLLSLGDQVNSYDSETEYIYFGKSEELRSLPIMTVPGNHDAEYTYSRYFTYSNVDEATRGNAGIYGGDYWFSHDGVLFMILNCVDISESLHRDFIERAIEEYTGKYGEPKWKIVSLHYSPYSGSHDEWYTNYRKDYSPIFSSLGIDAVISGHDHVYARAYMSDVLTPIDDPARYVEVGGDPYGSFYDPEPGQIFYMTANSASGSKYCELARIELPYLCNKNQENVPNITKVDVNDDMLVFTTYRTGLTNEISDVVDFFALHHTKGVTEDKFAPVLTVPAETVYDPAKPIDLMKGIKAYDNFDGDLTYKITVAGEPNPKGDSIITYTVTDKAGNTATAERKLIVPNAERCISTDKTEWKYLDTGEAPFDIYEDAENQIDWTKRDFDDSGWKTAKGGFASRNNTLTEFDGFKANTKLEQYMPDDPDDEVSDIPCYFFRSAIDVEDPDNIESIEFDITFDDGFDIYINGVIVRSLNPPYSDNLWNYSGSECSEYVQRIRFTITDKDLIRSLELRPAGNVIAVELFQSSHNSDDIFFDLNHLDMIYPQKIKLPFTDVEPNAWYTENIRKAYARGLFSGVSDTSFDPGGKMTRAMIWTVLTKVAGAEAEPGETWYSGPRKWAMENGVSDGTYPDSPITREQFVTMLYAFYGRPEVKGDLEKYSDKDQVSFWAKDALVWAVSNGVITGRSETTLAPKGAATRAEACTIIIKATLK